MLINLFKILLLGRLYLYCNVGRSSSTRIFNVSNLIINFDVRLCRHLIGYSQQSVFFSYTTNVTKSMKILVLSFKNKQLGHCQFTLGI